MSQEKHKELKEFKGGAYQASGKQESPTERVAIKLRFEEQI